MALLQLQVCVHQRRIHANFKSWFDMAMLMCTTDRVHVHVQPVSVCCLLGRSWSFAVALKLAIACPLLSLPHLQNVTPALSIERSHSSRPQTAPCAASSDSPPASFADQVPRA